MDRIHLVIQIRQTDSDWSEPTVGLVPRSRWIVAGDPGSGPVSSGSAADTGSGLYVSKAVPRQTTHLVAEEDDWSGEPAIAGGLDEPASSCS